MLFAFSEDFGAADLGDVFKADFDEFACVLDCGCVEFVWLILE